MKTERTRDLQMNRVDNQTFNRTSLELKLSHRPCGCIGSCRETFNRTSLELKHHTVCKTNLPYTLLIEPVWN